METTTLSPGASARRLFSTMVARADGENHLTLTGTLNLAVDRQSTRFRDASNIRELQSQGWISQADDGGWSF